MGGMEREGTKSSPLIWGALGLTVCAAVYLNQTSDSPDKKVKPALPKARRSRSAEASLPNTNVPFPTSERSAPNVFQPMLLSKKDGSALSAGKVLQVKDATKIPGDVANGDGNWEYVGFAQIDGHAVAMLENPSSEQVAMVRQGESWRSGKLMSVDAERIVFQNDKGGQVRVGRKPEPKEAPGQPGTPGPGQMPAGMAFQLPMNFRGANPVFAGGVTKGE